jgi:outer membrane protein TolC
MKTKGILILALVFLTGFGAAYALEQLTLPQAATVALSQNPAIRQAEIRVEKADMAVEQASQPIPYLDYLRDLGILPYDQLRMLDLGPAQAAYGRTLAGKGAEVTRNQLVLEAKQKYLALNKAQDNLVLAKEALERVQSMLRIANASYHAGLVPRSDILGAEAQVAATRARLLAAENGVELAVMDLNRTMGRNLDAPLSLAGSALPSPESAGLSVGISSALRHRFEMVDGRETLKLRQMELEHAMDNLEPGHPSLKQAELNVEEAELTLRINEQNIRLQVSQLHSGLQVLERQLETLEKSVSFARESYRIAALRYEAGVTSQMEMQNTQANLHELETQYLHARYDRYLTYLQWLFATGQTLEP